MTLKQPFRAVLGLTELLTRVGLSPSPLAQLEQPAAVRQLSKPPFWMTRKGDPRVTTREVLVEGRGGPVRVRLYLPEDLQPGTPTILYLHGGGFVLGGLDGCDYITRSLASRTRLLVASVEYRLAPYCPYPGPLDDCVDALRWLVNECPEGIDGTRVAVAGDSAGGNLAAALALRVRDEGGPHIAHQTLIYPFLDATISASSWTTYAGGGIDVDAGHRMVSLYAPNHEAKDPYVSPLHAEDLSGLPPALVLLAEVDVLHGDGHAYAKRLVEAGVPTVRREFARVPHGFVTMPRLCKEAELALDLIASEMSHALYGEAARRD
ncbi:MAG: alpha/beta hydrolase [Actinomycetota bacterium]|nr:alpha/beta hydrolase [Actinomycetota bacterium]